jgi:hypothetical protein
MTLVVLEGMRSGAFSRELVDVCTESFINLLYWLTFLQLKISREIRFLGSFTLCFVACIVVCYNAALSLPCLTKQFLLSVCSVFIEPADTST